ncbi:MAG: phosphatase PAP2 family protein [Microthrixaceae bacterium]|nr:phosphatase PAP2 family protein [Microthrixaceae bacterium]
MTARGATVAARLKALFDVDRFLVVATVVGLGVAAGCSVVIAKLLDDVMGAEDAARLDPRILAVVVEHRSEALTSLFSRATNLGDPLVVTVVAVVVVVMLLAVNRRLALLVVASTTGTVVITTVAKAVVDRPRPPEALWLDVAAGPAFPSGHAAQSIALYGAIAVVVWRLVRYWWVRIPVLVVAAAIGLAVGLSRVYLGSTGPPTCCADGPWRGSGSRCWC